jgi:hypothetical protein
MSREAFIGVLVLIGAASIAGEWYWKHRDFVICRAGAMLEMDRRLDDKDAAAVAGFLEAHFSREDDYSLSMSAGTRQGELSGIFRRKISVPSELARRLGGGDSESDQPRDKASVEQAVKADIESIPLTLTPGSFSIQLVINDKQLIAQARGILQAAVPGLLSDEQLEDVPAVYAGTDPARDARLIADLNIGPGQAVVLGKYWSGDKNLLAIFLVDNNPVVGATQVLTFNEMEDVDPLMQSGGPSFNLKLVDDGAKAFEAFTSANIGRKAAIVINDFAHSAPQIQAAIKGGSLVISLGTSSSRGPGQRMVSSLMMGKAGLPDPGLAVKDISVNCY